MPTTILLDSGYFVGRMQKHWSPKGKMRRAHNSFKKKKTNWFQRQYQFQKALNSDLGYIEVVMSRMRVNPKYDKSCSLIVCFDGIYGRRLRAHYMRATKPIVILKPKKTHPLTKAKILEKYFPHRVLKSMS